MINSFHLLFVVLLADITVVMFGVVIYSFAGKRQAPHDGDSDEA